MLSISSKSRYGLKALLALAESFDQGLLPIKEIAARQDIPRQYLEQIFNQLGKADIIRSTRGKRGGYQLARPPGEIMVSEIIVLLEGGIEFASRTDDPTDVINVLLKQMQEKLLEVLELSLADLLSQLQASRNVPFYTI
ncbi:MAG: Rrf2 family transcriptional regulator [Desulfobacterales bacterium]|nr:Rrf2 family transcriptional regulator [Desulfobacterales bacterium]